MVSTSPPGVITSIVPVVAPLGTSTLILVAVSFVMVPATPLKVTELAPKRLVPLMVTTVPTGPPVGVKVVMVGVKAGSTAPMVHSLSPGRGRANPRWSVLGHTAIPFNVVPMGI